MSKKQMKQIIGIVIGLIVVVALVFCGIFMFGGEDTSNDIEAIKAAGGYENMKSDFQTALKLRESVAGSLANKFFEDIGVKKYEGIETGVIGKKTSTKIVCDGFDIYCSIRAGELAEAYIGNIMIYRDAVLAPNASTTVSEYTLQQYQTFVTSFTRALKLEEAEGKALYEQMTSLDIMSLSNIKKGKLNGVKGYYGIESNMKYFFTLTATNKFDKMYIVCDAFDPILFYDSADPKGSLGVKSIKVLAGKRQGIANVMGWKCKQIIGCDEVIVPAALMNGDDSWLMVNGQNGVIYLEVKGEIKTGEDKKSENFKIKIGEGNEILWLKVGKKVYKGE